MSLVLTDPLGLMAESVALAVVAQLGAATTPAAGPSTAPTLATFAKRWTSGELTRLYPDHVKAIHQDDNRERLAKLLATKLDGGPWRTLGSVPLDRVTVEHAFTAMQALPPIRSAGCHVPNGPNGASALATDQGSSSSPPSGPRFGLGACGAGGGVDSAVFHWSAVMHSEKAMKRFSLQPSSSPLRDMLR